MSLREDMPVLDPGTRLVRQVENGKARFIVRAGTTGKYLRVGEAEAAILELLNGERTMARVRTSYMAHRKENIALSDIASFVNRMRGMGVVKPTVEARNLMLVEKARQRRVERHFSGRFGALLFMRRKLFDPDWILDRLVGPLGFMFTRGFVIFSVVTIVLATLVLVQRWDEVAGGIRNMGLVIGSGSGLSLGVIWLTALTVVFIHEFGHGLTCKHFGGEVHEMGVLLLFFQPCFYANVNDAWTFESRSARLWVTAAGGFIETVLGSLCVLVWSITEPGTTVHGVAQVVFTISLSSTLLFNMNPLIKLDGYYLLADFLGIENLRDRSTTQLNWYIRNRIFGLPAPKATEDPKESRILVTYAVLSAAYMGLLLFVIASVIFGVLFGDGAGPGPLVLIVLFTLAYVLLKRPVAAMGGAMKEFARGRNWSWRSPRVVAGGTGVVLGGLFLAAVLPWTSLSTGTAVLEPGRVVDVVSPLPGVVEAILPGEGEAVRAGDPLFRVTSPMARTEVAMAKDLAARLVREAARREGAGDAAGAAVARKQAEAAVLRAADLEARLEGCDVRSPLDGRVLDRRVRERSGSPVEQDQVVLRVGDCSTLRAQMFLTGRAAAAVKAGMDARIRLHSYPGRSIKGKVVAVSGQAIASGVPGEAPVPPSMARWEVIIEVDNGTGELRPGMSGEASVEVAHTTALAAAWHVVRGTFRADLF